MGTTLTGTTPQDTYDSLIKVTDNGPIGTSLKTLTDGLGNDSALALSSRGLKVNQSATLITDTASLCHFSNNYLYLRGGSAGLSIGDDAFSNSITLVDAGSIVFEAGSAERVRITSAGNVGIGTSSPNAPIQINGAPLLSSPARATIRTFDTSSPAANVGAGLMLGYQFDTGSFVDAACVQAVKENATLGNYATSLAFLTRANGVGFVENVRILSSGGITFNGDTAAANALDDYEEGTWSPQVYYQNATDQANATNVTQVGTYTKIGRQVTLCGVLQWTITGSPAVDNVGIKNFPFAAQNSADYFSFGQLQLINADSYPAATLDIFVNQNASVCIIATPAGLSNQGANIGATGTKTARFTITYFV